MGQSRAARASVSPGYHEGAGKVGFEVGGGGGQEAGRGNGRRGEAGAGPGRSGSPTERHLAGPAQLGVLGPLHLLVG